jgi:hypothetical protein
MVKAFRLVSSNPGIGMTVAAKRLSSFGEAGKGRRPIRRAIAAGMLRLDDGMRLYAAPETRWQSSGYLKAGKNRAERSEKSHPACPPAETQSDIPSNLRNARRVL